MRATRGRERSARAPLQRNDRGRSDAVAARPARFQVGGQLADHRLLTGPSGEGERLGKRRFDHAAGIARIVRQASRPTSVRGLR
jgi:hypothetical protein